MPFQFTNTRYPELNLCSVAGRCRFRGGRFVTEDRAVADALAALPEWYGIRAVAAPEPAVETTAIEQPTPAAESEQPVPRARRRKGGA
jgi:hypothetical protein